jgi:hypothetical protein
MHSIIGVLCRYTICVYGSNEVIFIVVDVTATSVALGSGEEFGKTCFYGGVIVCESWIC